MATITWDAPPIQCFGCQASGRARRLDAHILWWRRRWAWRRHGEV